MRRAAPALGAYLLLRLGCLLAVVVMARDAGADVVERLTRADGRWYLRIAAQGYDTAAARAGDLHRSDLAFFPLYPALVRVADAVLPGPATAAALAVSWAAGAAAAWGIFSVAARVHDERTGVLAAALWAVVPPSAVQAMASTEGLFTAFAAWALDAVLARRWWAAGVLTALAGLTRPTAACLLLAVAVAALSALRRRQDGLRPLAALLVAPVGLLGWAGWQARLLGRPDAYLVVQRSGWGTWFDGGRFTLTEVGRSLTEPVALPFLVATAAIGCALVGLALLAAERTPLPLLLHAAAVVVLVVGTHGYEHAKARLLLPAFPLLLPPAAALARLDRRYRVAALVVLGAAGAWYAGHVAVVWRFSP